LTNALKFISSQTAAQAESFDLYQAYFHI